MVKTVMFAITHVYDMLYSNYLQQIVHESAQAKQFIYIYIYMYVVVTDFAILLWN